MSYVFVLGVTALAPAMLVWTIAVGLPSRRLGLAMLAAAHAPFLVALSAGVAAVALPGSTLAIKWLPLATALAMGLFAIRRLSKLTSTAFTAPAADGFAMVVAVLVALGAGAVMARLSGILCANMFPTIANDALVYLAEARTFAATGRLGSLLHGLGDPASGLAPTHPHTGIFALYLGHALTFAHGNPAAGPLLDDLPVRIALQAQVAFLVAATAGAAMCLAAARPRAWLAALVAVSSFCLYAAFEYMSFASSRDPFRLVPWLALLTLLVELVDRRRLSLPAHLAAAAAAGCAVAAHTVSLYFIALSAPLLLAAIVVARVPLTQLAALAAAGVVGMMLPLAHYVSAVRRTGSVLGHGMNYFHYVGTPLEEAFRRYESWSARDLDFLSALDRVLDQHGPTATRVTLALAALQICLALLDRRRRNVGELLIPALLVWTLALPLLDLRRLFPIDMKEAMVANFRYAHTIFILGPLVLGMLAVRVVEVIDGVWGRAGARIATVAVVGLAAAFANNGLKVWRTYSSWKDPQAYRDTMLAACAPALALPSGATWLSDRTTLAYVCGRWPTFLYSPAGRRYFAVADVAEARARLEQDRVALVTLEEAIPGWWPETAFFRALYELVGDGVFEKRTEGSWIIFIRRAGAQPAL